MNGPLLSLSGITVTKFLKQNGRGGSSPLRSPRTHGQKNSTGEKPRGGGRAWSRLVNIDAFSVMMKQAFIQGSLRVPAKQPPWQQFTMEMASDARIEDMAWLTPTPGIQRYQGYRRYNTVDMGQYIIVNNEYDAGIRVPLRNILDDKVGGYKIAFSDLGLKAKMYPGVNVLQQLNLGTTTVCYDGSYFFSNTHNQGGGTAGSALPSPFNTGTSGLNLLNYTSGNVNDGLTYKAIFMLTYNTIKPMGFQWRMAPKLGTNSGSPESEENKEVRFWVDLELASFYGWWQDAILVNITNTPNITDMQVIVDQVKKQFRSFTLPQTASTDPPLYTHQDVIFGADVGICVCSTGLEQLLYHLLNEEKIGVSVAGSTSGFTNNIYKGNYGLVASGYLNSAAGT